MVTDEELKLVDRCVKDTLVVVRELLALRKDAERYRKLRAKAHSLTPLVLDPCCAMLTYTPDGLDAALDALPAVG